MHPREAGDQTPSTSLYAFIIDATSASESPPQRAATTYRAFRVPRGITGVQFKPPSESPCPGKCFAVASTPSRRFSPCNPRTYATPICEVSVGSSPNVSSARPHRISVRSSTGDKPLLPRPATLGAYCGYHLFQQPGRPRARYADHLRKTCCAKTRDTRCKPPHARSPGCPRTCMVEEKLLELCSPSAQSLAAGASGYTPPPTRVICPMP